MPRVYTKKIQNAAPLFLISRYSFRETMPDKKGNGAVIWRLPPHAFCHKVDAPGALTLFNGGS